MRCYRGPGGRQVRRYVKTALITGTCFFSPGCFLEDAHGLQMNMLDAFPINFILIYIICKL
jgi:hypothetical protein